MAGVGSTHASDSKNPRCQTVLNEGLVKGDQKCPTYVVMVTFFTLEINKFCSHYHRIAPVIQQEEPIEGGSYQWVRCSFPEYGLLPKKCNKAEIRVVHVECRTWDVTC